MLVRVDVGQAAYRDLKAGECPPRLTELVRPFAGMPPGLCPAVHIVRDLPANGWRALDGEGRLLAAGTTQGAAA